MNTATLLNGGDRPAVRLERRLPDPPPVVWRAITQREQLRAWCPCDVAVAGARWTPRGGDHLPLPPPDVIDLTLTGEVLAVDEPHVLAFTWGEEILRFELSPADGGTRLVLVDELPAGSAARNAAGWDVCLDRLVGLEPGTNAGRPPFEAYSSAFAPVLGPQEGPPAGFAGD